MFLPLRDENPTQRFPFVTISIMSLNTVVFLYHILSHKGLEYFVMRFGAIPFEITHFTSLPDVAPVSSGLTLLTSMFLHGSLFHLGGNMLYLWVFGNNIEDFLGPLRYALFYLVTGLAAGLTQIAVMPNSRLPMIGASGAVAGVLGAYWILYPRAKVMTLIFLFIFIRVIPISAGMVLGLWFLLQVLNLGMGGGVAWFAHIGGFLSGVGLILLYSKRRRRFV